VRRLRSRGQICGGSRGQISGWTLGPEPWTLGRQDVHGGGVGSYGGGVDPGARVADAEVVDEVAGFEVVGTVEDEVGGEEGGGVGGDEVGDVGVDVDAGVDAGEVAAGGFGFGEGGAGVVFVEEHLALEVGGLDEVAVDESQPADAGASQEAGGGGTGGADADDGDVGSSKELLAGFADAGEEDLAGVTVFIRKGQTGGGVGGEWVGGGDRSHDCEYTVRGGESGGSRASVSEPGGSGLHL
jgi:hypothetical protein